METVIKLFSPATRESWAIPILYEDDFLLAVDKPSRLLVSPDRFNAHRPNLMTLLHEGIERGAAWAVQRRLDYLANAHRLDFETSGVLLLAKTKAALIDLADQFSIERTQKTFVALVHGSPSEDQFQSEAKLSLHPVKPDLVRVDSREGKRSRTDFIVRERFQSYTLIECHPWTDRLHQIRVHLQSSGFPLVGDSVYGGGALFLSTLKRTYRLKPNRTERPLLERAALHLTELKPLHPVSKTAVQITAPWPKDLKVAVKYLREFAPGGSSPPPLA